MPKLIKSHVKGRRSRSTLSSILLLATSRLRHTWFLLSIMMFGMIAAIIIVCSFPLFADIMNTAGLRHELRAAPDSNEIQVTTVTLGLTTHVTNTVDDTFAGLLKQDLGNLVHVSQFETVSSDYTFVTPKYPNYSLTMRGASMQQASSHFGHLEGRMAQVTPASQHELEVMMTPDTAKKLGLKVGDTFQLQLSYYLTVADSARGTGVQQTQITGHLVGLFNVDPANSAYWHGNDFKYAEFSNNNRISYAFTMIVPNESLLAIADGLATKIQQTQKLAHPDTPTSALPSDIYSSGLVLRWYYQVDPSSISIHQLDTLINSFSQLQSDYYDTYSALEHGDTATSTNFPYLYSTRLSSPMLSDVAAPSTLDSFRSRIDVARVPVTVLTIQIVLLILFFISLMTSLLIESQTTAIALLRSRGASSSQIFGSLFTHYIVLGGVVFCAGIPLTILMVTRLAQHFLPAEAQDAITLVTNQPWQAAQEVIWYALGMLLMMLVTIMIALYFAARMDVLALRRDSSRTSKRPLWQRFNLDVLTGVVAIVGYGTSLYLNNVSNLLQGDALTLIITPLSVIAPFFLVLSCLFLLLRIFPLLLRLAAWLAVRGRGAASMLALAQVSRSPRMSIRTTMLLALSIAFLLFTLTYQSTQTQHIQDLTTNLVGTDFSGDFETTVNANAFTTTARTYQAIPGVVSSSIGFTGSGHAGAADLSMQVRAVDATTFGSTVIWPSQQASQTGNDLLNKLVKMDIHLVGQIVPAIIDTTTANRLHLSVSSVFTMTIDGYEKPPMKYVVLGILPSIPTINTITSLNKQGQTKVTGGILVNYKTYIDVFTSQAKADPELRTATPAPLNHAWLHSRDGAAETSVHSALAKLHLSNLTDRRAILAELNTDPLYLILSGILSIGTITALLLALLGNLLTSWLSARTRLTNFAVLRAIGSTPRQVASVLTWEQAIVYLTGAILGIGIGIFIVQTVIPALIITNLNTDVSSNQFYALQSILPAHVVMPTTLLPALLTLLAIYGIALITMVRVVSQPSLSQTLRLNED